MMAPLAVLPPVHAFGDPGTEFMYITWDFGLLKVNEFYANGSFWRTLDFQFWVSGHSYATEETYNGQNGWQVIVKTDNKFFNNSGAANTTIVGYSMTVGINGNTNSADAHDNLICTIDDNLWINKSGFVQRMIFVDDIAGSGPYRLQVVRTDTNATVFDYPTQKSDDGIQINPFGTFLDQAFPEYSLPYANYAASGRGNDTGYWTNMSTYQDQADVYGIAMQLGIDVYNGSQQSSWTYDYSSYRFQVNNTGKWWFQVFDTASFMTVNNSTLTEYVYKLLIGFEDGTCHYDNFIDVVMCVTGIWDYFQFPKPHQIDDYHQWTEKLDFAYCCGAFRKQIEFENGTLGCNNWTPVFGASGWQSYASNIPLNIVIYSN